MKPDFEYWEYRFLRGGEDAIEEELWASQQGVVPNSAPWLENLREGLVQIDAHIIAGTIDQLHRDILHKAPPNMPGPHEREIDIKTGERLDVISNFFAGVRSDDADIARDFQTIRRKYIGLKDNPAQHLALFRQLRTVPRKRGPNKMAVPWAGEKDAMNQLRLAEKANQNIERVAKEIADSRGTVAEKSRLRRRLLGLYADKMSLRKVT